MFQLAKFKACLKSKLNYTTVKGILVLIRFHESFFPLRLRSRENAGVLLGLRGPKEIAGGESEQEAKFVLRGKVFAK